VRKKYDVAITEYKMAVEGSPTTTTMVRLAGVYDQAGKPNESLALLTKVLADPNVQPVVKQFAEREKLVAEKLKATAK